MQPMYTMSCIYQVQVIEISLATRLCSEEQNKVAQLSYKTCRSYLQLDSKVNQLQVPILNTFKNVFKGQT